MLPNGEIQPAQSVLLVHGVPLLQLDPEEELALVNGDNFSTALALYGTNRLIQYLLVATVIGAMTIELLKGSTRSFHPLLAAVRPHPGQQKAAHLYRYLLSGSPSAARSQREKFCDALVRAIPLRHSPTRRLLAH